MSTSLRLGLFALLLAVVFGAAWLLGGLLVPDHVVASWLEGVRASGH